MVGWSHLRKVQLDLEEVLKLNQMSEYQGAPGNALLINPAALSHSLSIMASGQTYQW